MLHATSNALNVFIYYTNLIENLMPLKQLNQLNTGIVLYYYIHIAHTTHTALILFNYYIYRQTSLMYHPPSLNALKNKVDVSFDWVSFKYASLPSISSNIALLLTH